MKILMIAPTPFFADRGCHMRILGEIRALQSENHEIILTTYHIGRDVGNLNIKRIINIPWYNKLEAGSSWHKFYLDVFLLITTISVYLKERPNIIHGHLHEGALIGKIVSVILSMGKTPVIFDVQGSLTKELDTYGFFNSFKALKFFFMCAEKLICKLPNYFVCSSFLNSHFIKQSMNVSESKVATVMDGIFEDYFSFKRDVDLKECLNIPKEKKVVIYTGSLMQSKGINYLLNAIPKIKKMYSNVYFLIIGYPVEQSKKIVNDLNLQDLVKFTGKVEFFQLPKYLDIANVAVDPKVDEAGEGSGKMINYMGAGLPVVCFDNSNNRLFLGENGFYAKSEDSGDLANKILEVLNNEDIAKAVGHINQKRVHEKFSWGRNGIELSKLYRKVLKNQV